jgi:hypothetical protein
VCTLLTLHIEICNLSSNSEMSKRKPFRRTDVATGSHFAYQRACAFSFDASADRCALFSADSLARPGMRSSAELSVFFLFYVLALLANADGLQEDINVGWTKRMDRPIFIAGSFPFALRR